VGAGPDPDRLDDLIMGDWGTSVSAGVWAHMQQPFMPWLPAPSPGTRRLE